MEEDARAQESDPEKELLRVAEQLDEARAKLRKAEAFKLPERTQLTKEVASLERRQEELQARLAVPEPQPGPPPPPPLPQVPAGLTRNGRPVAAWTDADWEELAVASEKMSVEQRFDLAQALGRDGRERLGKLTARREEQRRGEEEQRREEEEAAAAAREQASRGAASELLSKLTFERLKEMSNEERFEVAKEVGPAYAVSLALVALCYWALNIPFLAYAYHESTGLWPDLGSLDSLDSLQAAGTFASIFAAYALLKPVRLFVALLVTPWTVENVMPALTRLGSTGDGEGK